jgi:hypothetical protein
MNDQALAHLIVGFVRALESADLLFLEKYLAADVVYVRSSPTRTEVPGKDAVIARMEPFLRAFAGWSLTAADISADSERHQVTCSLHITGENKGDMDFRVLGQGTYTATGKVFALPPGHLALTVCGAEICRIDIDFPQGGGLTGIFEQIGPHR